MPQISSYNIADYDEYISCCIDKISSIADTSIKVAVACEFFLNTTYEMWCVGEGPSGEINQKPIYRSDVFDCVSFTNTILAIVNSSNLDEFKQNYVAIKYKNSQVAYLNNNYFIEEDWLQHNEPKYIESVTASPNDKINIKSAKTIIDYPAWINHHALKDIFYLQADSNAAEKLDNLFKQAKNLKPKKNILPYFTHNDLLANKTLFKTPMVAIVVRDNWDASDLIGTHLNVSHLGILIPATNTYYHASSYYKKVVATDFNEYVKFSRDTSKANGFHFCLIK